jgi:hypothetical protein
MESTVSCPQCGHVPANESFARFAADGRLFDLSFGISGGLQLWQIVLTPTDALRSFGAYCPDRNAS